MKISNQIKNNQLSIFFKKIAKRSFKFKLSNIELRYHSNNEKNVKNFIKSNENKSISDSPVHEKISQQYDYTRHTLMKNLYMFNYASQIAFKNQIKKNKIISDNIVYFLVEPLTKSLIGIDLFLDIDFPYEFYRDVDKSEIIIFAEKNLLNNLNKAKILIQKLENLTNSRLNYIFLTRFFDKEFIKAENKISNPEDNNLNKMNYEIFEKIKSVSLLKNKINRKFWKDFRKEVRYVSGNNDSLELKIKENLNFSGFNFYSDKYLNDIETMSVGELCFAGLHTPGISEEQFSYVITQVNDKSTKIPFLFTGEVLSIGSFGNPYIIKSQSCSKLYESLRTLLSLPNDTLLYPSKNLTLENLERIEKIDSDNIFANEKLKWAKEQKNKGENAVGSRLIEEKFYNPAFRLDDDIYTKIFGDGLNPMKKFEKLIRLKEMIDEQIKTSTNSI